MILPTIPTAERSAQEDTILKNQNPSFGLSALREVLTRSDAPTEEIREAVLSAEALVAEARRELAARDFRHRRAAHEALSRAVENQNADAEEVLAEAIAEAWQAKVEAVDIELAESRLAELQSMSSEQRAKLALRQKISKKKELAFLLVKRNEAASLQQLLDEVDDDALNWQDWRDHSGRSLLRFSKELGAIDAQQCLLEKLPSQLGDFARPRRTDASTWPASHLEPLRELSIIGSEPAAASSVPDAECGATPPSKARKVHLAATESDGEETTTTCSGTATPDCCPSEKSYGGAETTLSKVADSFSKQEGSPDSTVPCTCAITVSDDAAARTQAFRATVQNDVKALCQVLESVPQEVWSTWQNKAGRDLLTLAEERGSSGAYCVLARALGMIQERRQETFKESESVWVLELGQVQPRRASILEDCEEHTEDVLLEYWDGCEAPCRVARALILK
jgi:hypothetical protein